MLEATTKPRATENSITFLANRRRNRRFHSAIAIYTLPHWLLPSGRQSRAYSRRLSRVVLSVCGAGTGAPRIQHVVRLAPRTSIQHANATQVLHDEAPAGERVAINSVHRRLQNRTRACPEWRRRRREGTHAWGIQHTLSRVPFEQRAAPSRPTRRTAAEPAELCYIRLGYRVWCSSACEYRALWKQ